ncbi:MAG TPA: type II secretion system protein [Phycisphaerales bacterium]|nr:type II secretion system protein [Phycisphaerales bacterium]
MTTPRSSRRLLRRKNGRTRRAFTLVEVLVVMVIIAVLAMLTVPRLIGAQARQADIEAQAVRALLSQAAQRDAVSSDPLALRFDPARQELAVQSLQEKDGERTWRSLPLIRALHLSSIEIAGVSADGQPQPFDTELRIPFGGARPRPGLSLLLRTSADMPGAVRAWQVDLSPGQTVAVLRPVSAAAPLTPPETAAIDLDEQGLRTQPW